jgi:uncharacterized membrane protein YkvA (DUF1232 family)
MKVSEQIINSAIVPRLNQSLPGDLYVNALHLYNGYAVAKAQIKVRGEWMPVLYTLQLDSFRFDALGRYVTFIYTEEIQKEKTSLAQKLLHETEIFLAKNLDKTLIMNVLKDKQDIHISDTKLTIQLAPLIHAYPVLQDFTVTALSFEKGALHLEAEGPPDLPLESIDFDWMEPLRDAESQPEGETQSSYNDGELIVLENEHKRYYDRLRSRIEKYMKEKIGDSRTEKLVPYLLLAPDLFVLLARLAKDSRVPLRSKSIALAAVIYFMSPLDIVPDFIAGPGGFIDDIIFAVMALNKMLVDVDEKIINEHWTGDRNIMAVIRDVLAKADSLVGTSRLQMIKNVFKSRK